MRITWLLLVASGFAGTALAQTDAGSFGALQAVLKPGQMIVVTEQTGHVTKGLVGDLTDSMMTLMPDPKTRPREGVNQQRIFSEESVYTIRRTDSLGNGTAAGLTVGILGAAVMTASCGRYKYAEERGPCVAANFTSGILWSLVGAIVGREIDRAVGNQEVYRRTLPAPSVP